jgi:hypothetical protein
MEDCATCLSYDWRDIVLLVIYFMDYDYAA